MGSERRRLKEELEAREKAAMSSGVAMGGGWKKKRTGGDEEAEFERQLNKLKEEGARLKMKREEALRKAEMKAKEEEEVAEEKAEKGVERLESRMTESMFSEMDRTIFIKLRTSPTTAITEPILTKYLSKFGEISSCLVREPPPLADKDKKKKEKRRTLTTGVLVFKSILSAYDVVHTFRNGPPKEDPELWERVKDVKFAGGKELDVSGLLPRCDAETLAPPQTAAYPEKNPVLTAETHAQKTVGGGAPRFSFRPTSNITTGTPKAGAGLSSADYESATLLRMREMEKKILEAD